jgi:uncharacterized membrane protein HdeD (DUF308 family)/predicted flap endonuclease-1-like 5' DNA nuclease
MASNPQTGSTQPVSIPWWLVLIEAIAAIIIGLLLLINPGSTIAVVVRLLGFYLLFSGILSIISIFIDRSAWGWKLISGILGVLAGIVIIDYPLWSALIVPTMFLVVIAIFAIIIGIINLIHAFQGAGWGKGALGALSILLGVVILARPLLTAISLPLILGILALAGGFLALIDAFRLRGMQISQAEAVPEGVPSPEAVPEVVPSPEAVAAETAPPESPPAAPSDSAADPDLEFLGLTSHEDLEKFHRPLEYIEGIGPVYAGKLSENGISTPLDMLREGATPEGRKDIAKRTEISGLLILEWINHIDLYRIKGVGSEYADLLEESGVDTVMELAHRNPDNLFEKMSSVNEVKQLVRKLPAQSQVVDWIGQANELPRVIQY